MSPSASTQVFQLSRQEGQRLAQALRQAQFEFRPLQHAEFQARGEGVVVSLYKSGKLVVQGKDAAAFQVRFLPSAPAAKAKESSKEKSSLPQFAQSLGSDEAGKGDTFGSLVVAAVALPADKVEILQASKVADSKALEDQTVRALAPWLQGQLDWEVCSLLPDEYNQRWQQAGRNVNKLLCQLHVQCLERLQQRSGFTLAVVDRFAPSCPVQKRFTQSNPQLKVVEIPRAEAHLAVAAASVLARHQFLCDMDQLSSLWALTLPRGSGQPVGPALRRFVQIHGVEKLGAVAKLHFKNVQNFLAQN